MHCPGPSHCKRCRFLASVVVLFSKTTQKRSRKEFLPCSVHCKWRADSTVQSSSLAKSVVSNAQQGRLERGCGYEKKNNHLTRSREHPPFPSYLSYSSTIPVHFPSIPFLPFPWLAQGSWEDPFSRGKKRRRRAAPSRNRFGV